ncbi:MAG: hypothetical protein EAZ53_12585 [Bacteroidetes bacterium]|nr:MAG: hypothetical protein EAZ53_12585 [Bacteroidota bacterium]
MCIVGAGTTGSNRRIRFFNEGGAKFDGQIEVNSNVWIKDQYALQFGPRVGLPDGNAASIKLGTSGTDEYLNIFGGTGNGKAYPARKVQIFTEGGGLIQGKMKIQDPWSPIGAGHADALLDVNGNIYSRKNVVTQLNWADDEFDAQSPSLEQEQATATKEKHLIGVPKECELNETGLDLGKMQEIQMRKIEQLYKHLWKMNQRMEQLEKENELLRNR